MHTEENFSGDNAADAATTIIMSRHRDVRNLDADDYGDDEDEGEYGSSYGSSYVDETTLSTSMENYMYRRNSSGHTGHTPKMSHFVLGRTDSLPEEDEDGLDEDGRPRVAPFRERSDSETSSGSNTYDDLDEQDRTRLARCLEDVLDIVGDTIPEHTVKEAIVRCDFDSEVAVNTLLNNPVGHRSAGGSKTSPRGAAATGAGAMAKDDTASASLTSVAKKVKTSSPRPIASASGSGAKPIAAMNFDDIPTIKTPTTRGGTGGGVAAAGGHKKSRPKIIEVGGPPPPAQAAAAAAGAAAFPEPAVNQLLQKPLQVESSGGRRSRSQSPVVLGGASAASASGRDFASPNSSEPPSGRETPVHLKPSDSSASLSSLAKATPMRKAKVDPAEAYRKQRGQESSSSSSTTKQKDLLNLVVVGHVDSGKSTLMGHLLYRLGQVTKKAMHKYEQESRKLGKQSFAYAWVLDETSEERERGITMDVGQSRFETERRSVVLLDAPGHKDFIPNMISGAYQADVAILVVNAARGEFEAGFDAGGQTREHALLVRSLGVSQLAVAVNKMDTVEWSRERFAEIAAKLGLFLRQVGFREADTRFVPCSGFTGDNLAEPSPHLSSWHGGGTLVDAVDGFRPPERQVDRPFRLSISDVFRPLSGSGFSVAGRVESGYVQREDKVLLVPLNEVAAVKSVSVEALPDGAQCAFAGDQVVLTLTGPDQASVAPGNVACDPAQPVVSVRRFRARVVIFNAEVPITKGFPCVLHYGCVQAQASIRKLVSVINKSTGEVTKSRPRCLTRNCNAVVEVSTDSPVCLELYSSVKELGRFMLRSGGKTIAAGLVTDLL